MGFILTNSWLGGRPIWVPNVLILVLIGFAGVLTARIAWLWLAPAQPPVGLTVATTPSAMKTTPQAIATQISGWHLFGQAAVPEAQNATAVQPSSLGLRLEGIMSGSQPPLVMLRVGSEVRLLQVGDAVSQQVTITAIEPDRVLISNQGRLEAIAFPQPMSLNQAPPPSAARVERSVSPALNATVGSAAGASVDVAQIMRNPQSLMKFVTVAPLQENGVLTGYTLSPVPGQEAFMQQLGLLPGDVLTSIDGMPVNDPSLLPRVMPLLSSGQPLNVWVERGGQPMSVTINLDSLR